jgi:Asp-tRNA(Asn)/Glu-tRNA(Gln) amidotransferase C subunit
MMDEATVRELARAADLPLEEGRVSSIAPQLATWIEAASELSRKMAAFEHRAVQPITTFQHPSYDGRDE